MTAKVYYTVISAKRRNTADNQIVYYRTTWNSVEIYNPLSGRYMAAVEEKLALIEFL